jgi:hypothetical protein
VIHPARDEDARADNIAPAGAVGAGQRWSTIPAEWFDREHAAGRLLSDFLEICRRGSVEQVMLALEGVWRMLDRAAMWVSSVHASLAGSSGFLDQTCAALLPAIPHRIRALTCMGRASLGRLPTAMAAARGAFEAGLRLAWMDLPDDPRERAVRALLIHNSESEWKRKVAADYDVAGVGGERCRQAAKVQHDIVLRGLAGIGSSELPKRVPSVAAQLRELDLERLYSGYRLSSAYVHAGLTSALDTETVLQEHSPSGAYWPNDWYLAVNMCAWACVLVPRRYIGQGFDLGPPRGAMLAAELVFVSPGPECLHGSGTSVLRPEA